VAAAWLLPQAGEIIDNARHPRGDNILVNRHHRGNLLVNFWHFLLEGKWYLLAVF